MVEDRVTDGTRIAQLLASELSGREDSGLDALAVVDADPDVEGSADGDLAYRIAHASATDEPPVAEVFVHPDRARVEFKEGVDAAAETAEEATLRVRPTAVRPPRTIVFVESGAEAKRATDVFVAVLQADEDAR